MVMLPTMVMSQSSVESVSSVTQVKLSIAAKISTSFLMSLSCRGWRSCQEESGELCVRGWVAVDWFVTDKVKSQI